MKPAYLICLLILCLAVSGSATAQNLWSTVAAWSADSRYVAFGLSDGTIQVTDTTDNSQLIIAGHTNIISTLDWSPVNGDYRLASGSYDQVVKIWNGVSGNLEQAIIGYRGSVSYILWSADASRLITIDSSNLEDVPSRMLIKNVANGSPAGQLPVGAISGIARSTDNSRFALANYHNINIYEMFPISKFKDLKYPQLGALGYETYELAWHPGNNNLIATGTAGGTLQIWDINAGVILSSIATFNGDFLDLDSPYPSGISGLAFTPDGSKLISISRNGMRNVVAVSPAGMLGHVLDASQISVSEVIDAAFSPDMTRVALATKDSENPILPALDELL